MLLFLPDVQNVTKPSTKTKTKNIHIDKLIQEYYDASKFI